MDRRVVALTVLAVPATSRVVLAAPPPPPRLPAPHTLKAESELPSMVKLSDGSLRYVDMDARFVAVIHPDGRIVMRDLPNVDVGVSVLGITVVDRTLGLNRAIDEATRDGRPTLGSPELLEPDPEDPVDQAEAAVQKIPHGPYGPPPILFSLKMTFGGLADRFLRKGQRKRTKAKQAFLEATAPLRDAMAREQADARQRRALLSIGQQLATLWGDESRSLAERKRAIFERWDDCIEASPDAADIDDALRPATDAEAMRRKIERFIRQVAPRGSTKAFSPTELRRLNAGRHSRQPFDPYAPHDEARADPEDPGARRAP